MLLHWLLQWLLHWLLHWWLHWAIKKLTIGATIQGQQDPKFHRPSSIVPHPSSLIPHPSSVIRHGAMMQAPTPEATSPKAHSSNLAPSMISGASRDAMLRPGLWRQVGRGWFPRLDDKAKGLRWNDVHVHVHVYMCACVHVYMCTDREEGWEQGWEQGWEEGTGWLFPKLKMTSQCELPQSSINE